MANDRNAKRFTTGKGELVGFNAVSTPSTMFDPEGKYTIQILISKEEGEAILADALKIRNAQYKEKKGIVQDFERVKPYIKVEKNKDTGEIIKQTPDPQGRYVLKADQKAQITCKDKRIINISIPVVDCKGQPVKGAVKLGEGSIVKLNVELSGYSVGGKTGVSLKLKAVQIIDLVEYTGSLGFGEEDGSFEADDEVEETKQAETTEADDEEGF